MKLEITSDTINTINSHSREFEFLFRFPDHEQNVIATF